MINLRDPAIFEAEVRRIGRALWPSERYSGPIIFDARERDAIFVTEDVVYYLEATISKEEAKTKSDIKKLEAGITKLRQLHPEHLVRGIFVTLDDPTGHQGVLITNLSNSIKHYSFDQFRSRLINARSYLDARENYPFGSARDPASHAPNVPNSEFVETALFIDGDTRPKRSADVARSIQAGGKRFLVLGDYGTGKSMLLKHIFLFLRQQTLGNHDHKFPVLLNLRDHREQSDPAEALHRHATKIGFDHPAQLVRAWRAGYCHLLLDGFDELPPRTTAQETSRARDIRRSSVELVRKFNNESRSDVSVVTAGRANFFPTPEELETALATKAFRTIELGEWSENEVAEFLRRKRFSGAVPDWLPKRPLLLGYLLARGLVSSGSPSTNDKIHGWLGLMRHIYGREADQMEIGVDGSTLLLVAARLANQARTKGSRLGPINFSEAKLAFEEVVKGAPEDRAINALLRLPGLYGLQSRRGPNEGVLAADTPANSSEFIDDEYADVLSAFDLVEFLVNPHHSAPTYWQALQHPLGDTGYEAGATLAKERILGSGTLNAAIHRVNDGFPSSLGNIDLISIAKAVPLKISKSGICIVGIHLASLRFDFDDADLSNISFKDCFFDSVQLMNQTAQHVPRFSECLFGRITSWFTNAELERSLNDCHWDHFEQIEDGAEVVGQNLPIGVKVLVNLLRKLYFQSVKGRRESALPRGLDTNEQQFVDVALDALRRAGGAEKRIQRGTPIWHPVKAFSESAIEIVRRPTRNSHPLLDELWDVTDG